jgi:hypothetical protein
MIQFSPNTSVHKPRKQSDIPRRSALLPALLRHRRRLAQLYFQRLVRLIRADLRAVHSNR